MDLICKVAIDVEQEFRCDPEIAYIIVVVIEEAAGRLFFRWAICFRWNNRIYNGNRTNNRKGILDVEVNLN